MRIKPQISPPSIGSPSFSSLDSELIANFRFMELSSEEEQTFANRPIRTKPQRIYNQSTLNLATMQIIFH